MANLFGTDGARGLANQELTCDIAFKLGQAAAHFFGPVIVVGRDTRISGDMLEAALSAGAMSMGASVLSAGIIPTPAVAYLTRELSASAGVVISASHNPPEYNGIKFFDAEGFKLSVELESEIEQYVLAGGAAEDELVAGDEVGVINPIENAAELYIDFAVNSIREQGLDFSGLKIALDCAHGAASVTSAEALRKLGAEVAVINDDFSGTDINVECGSTHLEPLKALVAETGAAVGIAHDGDADRVLFVDADGNEIDGDMVLAVCANDLKERGELANNTAVSTIMCNLGLVRAFDNLGIELEQTAVGDRHVLSCMREKGLVIGGEQSGHTILLEHNSTGDGLLTACHFLAACKRAGKTVGEAAQIMQVFPQVLINVKVADKSAFENNAAIADAIAAAEAELADAGRVLVRPSGTEPLIRVMVEAETQEGAQQHAEAIAGVVEQELA